MRRRGERAFRIATTPLIECHTVKRPRLAWTSLIVFIWGVGYR